LVTDISGQPHALDRLTLKTGPTCCFETSVANHKPTPPDNLEVRRS